MWDLLQDYRITNLKCITFMDNTWKINAWKTWCVFQVFDVKCLIQLPQKELESPHWFNLIVSDLVRNSSAWSCSSRQLLQIIQLFFFFFLAEVLMHVLPMVNILSPAMRKWGFSITSSRLWGFYGLQCLSTILTSWNAPGRKTVVIRAMLTQLGLRLLLA